MADNDKLSFSSQRIPNREAQSVSQAGRVGSRIFFEAVMAPINEMNHSNQHSLFMTVEPPWQGYVNSKSIDWN